ncbi:aminotransferase, class I/II [Leptospira yanagawae serovar Saopaulo str. Sao Paulo = ATCC 700523]|uniref:Aminotransferase, class I/II n=1 Tax=Leptospira yanagawae serovar Saopaulo str. Sao Paulo = ATCC 700523 TaxID=1249483 RepID=A0A5E8HIT7_9LEPT|nr:PLP-dependent aminotransferase family protein [Leptospira yanagawae]EOQ90633.1 aminotransferase, class I/II [Leptospira yanagawae serovar Saopaulo str. Sao Paulo = ATCC 700523]
METNFANLFFAERTSGIRSSAIREILKITVSDSEFLSFAGGLPNPSLLPSDLLENATEKTIRSMRDVAFQYGESAGYKALREMILEHFICDEGLDVGSICITSGSQQGLDILGKLLMDQKTNVLLENPVYLGALQAFSPYRPNFISLPMEVDGPNLNALGQILSEKMVHCFYANPSYQNPSTCTWSIAKRKEVALLLDEHGVILLEDEAYRHLDFMGNLYPSIASFRRNGDLTFVLGSFSKMISPGFRLGWVTVPKPYQKIFTAIKQGNDLNSNQFSQIVLYHLLLNLDIQKHLRLIQSYYLHQKNYLIHLLNEYLPELIFQDPLGGLFLWVEYPNVSEKKMMEKILEKKVVMVPGNEFRLEPSPKAFFRMNYSFLKEAEMEEGVRRINAVYRDIIT